MSADMNTWKWFGVASHLIIGYRCQFHLATEVGHYLVSTVGEYVPPTVVNKPDKMQPIGAGPDDFYETLVFPLSDSPCIAANCDCGQREVASWTELAGRRYATRGAATRGHMAWCAEWATKPRHVFEPEELEA